MQVGARFGAPAFPPQPLAVEQLGACPLKRRQCRRALDRLAEGLIGAAFETRGATAWADMAQRELRATGETPRRRGPAAWDRLTPQELQISRLVADGQTNREIAAQLYLSPRTIDYHLRKVFTKLGIGSRTDLIRDGLPQTEPA